MLPRLSRFLLTSVALLVIAWPALAADPLHRQIDALVLAKANGVPASPVADDAEFLRRVYLDFAGRIPSTQEARAFLANKSPDRRARLIDQLLAAPEYARRMQELFHVMLMERLGDHPEWTKYLQSSFAANKPWDQMVREVLANDGSDATKGASFFYAKRLENYGQNPIDYPGLTRDVGRLFLGMDLRCAECHNHLFVKDYKQDDFQGLHVIFLNLTLHNPKDGIVAEKPLTAKREYQSVFGKTKKETGPRLPGMPEMEIPVVKKGEEYAKPPDRKTNAPGVPRFSALAKLAEQLPAASNPAFSRNIVNRLWFILMGRGIVHPLDLHHSGNPPSHPELLDLLAQEFVAHKFDIKWMLRELALTDTYQRTSVLPASQEKLAPATFLAANEKRLSAEQLMWSMLEATGEKATLTADAKALAAVQAKFLKAFANPRREPEDDFAPSLKAALFLLNDETVLAWLNPKAGNLADRLTKLSDDKVAEELYLSVLTRLPDRDEQALVADQLKKSASRRPAVLGQLVWALLASTEFSVNH